MQQNQGKKSKKLKIKPDWHWITTIFGATIGISAAMSFLSNEMLSGGGLSAFLFGGNCGVQLIFCSPGHYLDRYSL